MPFSGFAGDVHDGRHIVGESVGMPMPRLTLLVAVAKSSVAMRRAMRSRFCYSVRGIRSSQSPAHSYSKKQGGVYKTGHYNKKTLYVRFRCALRNCAEDGI